MTYFWIIEINIQSAKIVLIQWLTTLKDTSLTQKIMEFRKSETKDWWDEISESEKKSIEQAIIQEII